MLSKKIHIQKKWPLKFKQSFSVNKLTKYHDGIVTHLFVFVLQNIFWSWVIFCTNCAFPISIVGLFTYKEYRFHVLWTRFFYPINILNQLRKYLNGKYDYSFTEINRKYQCNVYLLMAEDGQKRSSIQRRAINGQVFISWLRSTVLFKIEVLLIPALKRLIEWKRISKKTKQNKETVVINVRINPGGDPNRYLIDRYLTKSSKIFDWYYKCLLLSFCNCS